VQPDAIESADGREVGPPKNGKVRTISVVPRRAADARDAADRRRGAREARTVGLGHSSITTTINLCGHVLPSTEAALVDAFDAIYGQCDGAMMRRTRREVERARGLK
jgi:hypothetical protein